MKIAVLIRRSPEYGHYGPIVEAALARRHEVECWHDHGQVRDGLKGYQFPSTDLVPRFRNGTPLVRTYQGASELRSWMEAGRADAVISASPEVPDVPGPRPLWICKQFLIDSFAWSPPARTLGSDVLAVYSRWWLEWAAGFYEAEGLVPDRDACLRRLLERAAFVGLPEMDAVSLIDRDEVRRRWGIPPNRPVVVLFPFPQGVGRNTFWPKRICAEPSRLKQLANIAAFRRFEYLPHVRHGWNDRAVVAALRRFCDRNGAYLLVKSRRKTPVPPYLEALADRCVYDESLYPPTVLEALAIASFSVSYYSNSVFESVSLGVPHLCVTYTAEDYNGERSNFFSRYYTAREGSPFQFHGVSTAWSIPETLDRLPAKTLADFAIDPVQRTRYVEKFLTHDAGDGSGRTLTAIEQALLRHAGGTSAGAPA